MYHAVMRRKTILPKQVSRIADGVSIRVRFANQEQIELIKTAAARRGLGFNFYLQSVLQAVSQQVMAAPLSTSLGQLSQSENSQSD